MMYNATSKLGRFVDNIEKTGIALCMGLMTLLTFANVVARYVFNENILWALEVTVFLFAWLILLGASYGVKRHVHIGVDVVIQMLSPGPRKVLAFLSLAACLAFSIMLLVGSWDYWYPFATERSWLETDDIPMPDTLQFMSAWLNEGERYEKMPRMIPYFALPLGMALLTFRFLQLGVRIWRGEIDMLIASHEAEDAMEEAAQHRARED